jgi:hypothetical protein
MNVTALCQVANVYRSLVKVSLKYCDPECVIDAADRVGGDNETGEGGDLARGANDAGTGHVAAEENEQHATFRCLPSDTSGVPGTLRWGGKKK